MADENKIYRCNTCKTLISAMRAANKPLMCCDKPMIEVKELVIPGKEGTHQPIMMIEGNKVTVKVGEKPHAMEPEHKTELIQIVRGKSLVAEKKLNPGEASEAVFFVENTSGISARAFCDQHGLWRSK